MLSLEEFEQLVADAVSSLPVDILERMENVAITIQDWPTRTQLRSARVPPGSTLYGLYEGVPLTRRTSHYGMVTPDRITIFRGPLVTYLRTPEAIAEQVRQTVLHEIAHHFGTMDEEKLRRARYGR